MPHHFEDGPAAVVEGTHGANPWPSCASLATISTESPDCMGARDRSGVGAGSGNERLKASWQELWGRECRSAGQAAR